MRSKIFSFVKPSDNSKATGHTIVKFMASELGLPVVWDNSIADEKLDVLFLISGAAAYCNVRAELGRAIEKAGRVVWVQDDYTCEPTPPDSKAESPYRRAFVIRHEKKLPIDYWTTVQANANRTPASSYVQWNKLGYEPIELPKRRADVDTLIYYGVWRKNREKVLDRYLKYPVVRTAISTKKGNEYYDKYPNCSFLPIFARHELIPGLSNFGAGLYVEDSRSSTEFHSPARRFYEMLSAGLPMAFQPESRNMLAAAGCDVSRYVVEGAVDVQRFLKRSAAFSKEQAAEWRAPYRDHVRQELKKAMRKMRENI